MSLREAHIIEGFKLHLAKQFEGQKRETVSLTTGRRHSYLYTHLEEVPRLASDIINRVRYACPELLANIEPFFVEIIARGHDLLEDGYGHGCPRGCQNKPTCPEHYVRLAEDTRRKLIELGLPRFDAEFCVDQMRALSKDFSLPKEGRNQELYQRLRKHPFEIKCIKLADNWHNMSTLHGRGFKKAVKNYVKVRSSWSKVFNLGERAVLCDVGMVEDPEEMMRRTFLFKELYKALKDGRDLSNLLLPYSDDGFEMENPTELYRREIATLENMMIYTNVHGGAAQKIENICMPSVSFQGGPEVPMAAESQIVYAKMMEVERLNTLYMFARFGMKYIQDVLGMLMVMDSEVCVGKTDVGFSDRGMRERMLVFLDVVGMSGEQLLRMQDSDQFSAIIQKAIEREEQSSSSKNS